MIKYKFWIGFLLSTLTPVLLAAQSSEPSLKSVTVSLDYTIPADKSRKEAEALLLKRARKKAVEKAMGISVQTADVMMTTESGNNYFESYQQLVRNVVSGRIVEEKTPDYKIIDDGKLTITYSCQVAEAQGEVDPGFKVDLRANKRAFTVGEPLQLEVSVSKDAYITVFSITDDNRVSVLFPNQYMPDNRVNAYEVRKIPNAKEQQVISFNLQPDPQEPESNYAELLFCVATKSKISYKELTDKLNYSSNWIELNRWLMEIPRDQWTEAYLPYQVFPK